MLGGSLNASLSLAWTVSLENSLWREYKKCEYPSPVGRNSLFCEV